MRPAARGTRNGLGNVRLSSVSILAINATAKGIGVGSRAHVRPRLRDAVSSPAMSRNYGRHVLILAFFLELASPSSPRPRQLGGDRSCHKCSDNRHGIAVESAWITSMT